MSDLGSILGVQRSATGVNALDLALPELHNDTEAQLRAIENRIQTLLAGGKLTPDLALQAWIEYITLRKQINRLTSRVKAASQSQRS